MFNIQNAKEATRQQVRETYIVSAIAEAQTILRTEHKLDRLVYKQAIEESTLETDILNGMPPTEAIAKAIDAIVKESK
tara:strand:+ start:294 stop:527 length:234 start_codon:yes stop_codon:yes gene_type:complete